MIYLGSRSLGAVCIGVALCVPVLTEQLGDLLSRIAGLEAQVAANVALLVTLPDPAALAASIAAAAAQALATITDIISSIPGPVVSANVSLAADVAALLGLRASLQSLLATLSGAVTAGGIHLWSIDTQASLLSGEVAAALSGGVPGGGGPSATVKGILILTESPGSFAAMSTLLSTA